QLAPELLQLLVVAHAELLDRNLRAADLGHRGDPETAENIADAPDPEADDQEPDHSRHDDFSEPIGRGFPQTSKHERVAVLSEWERRSSLAAHPTLPARGEGRVGEERAPSPNTDDFKARIIGRLAGYRNLAVRGKRGRWRGFSPLLAGEGQGGAWSA